MTAQDAQPFAEILILGHGRSGSNVLCSTLVNLAGNAALFEIFHVGRVPGFTDYPEIPMQFAHLSGCMANDISDPALIGLRDADPVVFFDLLSRAAQAAGHRSMSCKIFPAQMTVATLERLLQRPNLRVVFLTRSRIGRIISETKGTITRAYVKVDTTEVRPSFDMKRFLRQSFQQDGQIEAFHKAVVGSGVPCTLLHYERDLDLDEELRLQHIEAALSAVGVVPQFTSRRTANWVVKQDRNPHWMAKISNGFEVASALAGLGLATYAEAAPLLDLAMTKPATKPFATVAQPNRNTDLLAEGGYNLAYSTDPVITFSAIQYDRSFLAEWMIGPDPAFGDRKGVHFLKPTWTMETSDLVALKQAFEAAQSCNPGHVFVTMHVSEREAANYRANGIATIKGNPNAFFDESSLHDEAPPHPDLADRDAVYIARLEDWKGHGLAAKLTAPHFVYANPDTPPAQAEMARLQQMFPAGSFVNHVLGQGSYRYLARPELLQVLSRARVALALSSVEGCMRSSTECLLAGLPAVSVPSVGGREEFYTSDTSLIVEPTPEAVAAGVAEMIARRLTRAEVRAMTLSRIREERHRFVASANRMVQHHLGPLAPEIRIEPLLDFVVRYVPLSSMIEKINDRL